jgi:hypothetical protein
MRVQAHIVFVLLLLDLEQPFPASMQTAAAEVVVNDIATVEQALRTKLRQTEQLKVG